MNENSYGDYTCTAHYSDGSTQSVTSLATWSENSSYASFNSNSIGRLTTSSVTSDQSCTITASYSGKTDTKFVTIKNVSIGPTPTTGNKLSNENVYAYPNPFNLSEINNCFIRFSLENSASVTIEIYDVSNRLVIKLLSNEFMQSNKEQSIQWDGKNGSGQQVSNGVYLYIITTDSGERANGSLVILR